MSSKLEWPRDKTMPTDLCKVNSAGELFKKHADIFIYKWKMPISSISENALDKISWVSIS